ncbi:AtpZ/AtpI family protein [Pedobacter aquatilis]|uniref:AtpZ/AtpI family protein n=1 Tax=Pedobacter aquatilis TaxID=351343 RepID=UPI0025B37EAF|nr:AtpZ/AtpI family protein [Pedobacter aquatilis]MDN3587946.1 AtpZ/AtpI family protein [Pedobacter aquatilis]
MDKPKDDNNGKRLNGVAKYSAIGFQMIATIGLLTFIGYKIDEHQKNNSNLITAIFALVGVALGLYQAIRQITKP